STGPCTARPRASAFWAGGSSRGCRQIFMAGRYHSLFAIREKLPAVLEVTAESEDGVVMAIQHRTLPLAAVQFHPESIMTLSGDIGLRLLSNVMAHLTRGEAESFDRVGTGR